MSDREMELIELGWRVQGAMDRENYSREWMRKFTIITRAESAVGPPPVMKRPKGLVVDREYRKIEDAPGI